MGASSSAKDQARFDTPSESVARLDMALSDAKWSKNRLVSITL